MLAHGIFENSRYTDTDLTGRDLAGIILSECSLVAPIVADSDLTSARLRDTLVERMQAPNLFAPRSGLHRVHIRDNRLGALDLFDADLRSVTIADSKLGLVNLRAATGRDVLFRGCILDELIWEAARSPASPSRTVPSASSTSTAQPSTRWICAACGSTRSATWAG
ncbi:hypothetical protein M1C57_19370 [Rhodococcus pyridinivorans]|uniref:pentapeptide repeat-containing protein n=1 Tax=Rhodococcus pyridinivorans TaxID=103816 RepID=UPI00200A3987|nr:hypothetical protein [Rhodococcus pyridinivorans]UPW03777.1 hypothetical protein M1C57_19370 [Rhodococcus pyridinivorans]